MKKALLFAQELVKKAIRRGEIAVDATCGNGYDTALLAQCVGAQGHVYAYDIQTEALQNTKSRLEKLNLQKRVTLLQTSHDQSDYWPQEAVAAVMFNLGYLPGGNHDIITKAETTKAALQLAVKSLKKDGIITLVIYTGHAGGNEEYQVVRDFCVALPQKTFAVLEYRFINQQNEPPILLAVKRLQAGKMVEMAISENYGYGGK